MKHLHEVERTTAHNVLCCLLARNKPALGWLLYKSQIHRQTTTNRCE